MLFFSNYGILCLGGKLMTSYQKLKAKYERLELCLKNLEFDAENSVKHPDTEWIEANTREEIYEHLNKSVLEEIRAAYVDLWKMDLL